MYVLWVFLMITCGKCWTLCGRFFLPASPLGLAILQLWPLHHRRESKRLHQHHKLRPVQFIFFLSLAMQTSLRSVCAHHQHLLFFFLISVIAYHFCCVLIIICYHRCRNAISLSLVFFLPYYYIHTTIQVNPHPMCTTVLQHFMNQNNIFLIFFSCESHCICSSFNINVKQFI